MKFRSSVVLSSSNQESNKSSKDGGGKRHLSSSSDSRFISPPHTLKPLPKPSSHTMQGFESDTFGKKQVPSALTSLSPRISKSPPPSPFSFRLPIAIPSAGKSTNVVVGSTIVQVLLALFTSCTKIQTTDAVCAKKKEKKKRNREKRKKMQRPKPDWKTVKKGNGEDGCGG